LSHRLISAGILSISILVGMASRLAMGAQKVSGQAAEMSQTEILLASGKVAEAEKAARSLVAQNPRSGAAYLLLGKVYDAEQRPEDAQLAYQQAIVQFQKANEQGDGSAELFLNMGSAYSHLQQFDKAKECYFQSIQLNSDRAAPYVRIGADYLTRNIPPQALAWLMRAVTIDPKEQEGMFLLATALVNGKYYETAQTYLEKYVVLRPDDAKGWLLLGDAYLNDEQPENGLKNYKSALTLLPQLASAHYLVGYAYYQLNDLANSAKYLNESLKIDPTLMEAHLWMADIAYRENQNDEALKQLQVIMAARPPSADTSHLLAKIYIRAKRYEEARKILLDALQTYPDDQRFHYLLALLYRNTGKTAEAEHELSIYEVAEKMRQLRHKYVRHSFVYVQ
jgi:tetratricopeptide (TPR) repeat protein